MTSFHCGSRLLNSTVAIFNMTHTEKTERVDNTFEIRTMIKSLYILAKSQKDEATLMKSCHTFQILGTLNRKFMSSWPYPIQPLASHWSIDYHIQGPIQYNISCFLLCPFQSIKTTF